MIPWIEQAHIESRSTKTQKLFLSMLCYYVREKALVATIMLSWTLCSAEHVVHCSVNEKEVEPSPGGSHNEKINVRKKAAARDGSSGRGERRGSQSSQRGQQHQGQIPPHWGWSGWCLGGQKSRQGGVMRNGNRKQEAWRKKGTEEISFETTRGPAVFFGYLLILLIG